jgi:hypothetical protein
LGYLADAVARGHFVRLAIAADGSAMAFVEASKRFDYVNDASTSPVGALQLPEGSAKSD